MRKKVEFDIKNEETFLRWLQRITDHDDLTGEVVGYRVDDTARRDSLDLFTTEMEKVLRRHDHKKTWRERPVEALIHLMRLELREFDVAIEFFEVSEARKELVDIANYCLILYDRLGMLDQDKLAGLNRIKDE